MNSERKPGHAVVTGAAGFIGRACVKEFLSRGWGVTALVHNKVPGDLAELERAGQISLRRVRLEDYGSLIPLLREARKIRGNAELSVVHCAGLASDTGRERRFRIANLDFAVNVARCLGELPGRLVFISTTDVYGLKDFVAANERTSFCNNLKNPYPRYKIEAEVELKGILPPERMVILRPAAVWGPGDTTILPRFLKFMKGSPFIVHFGRWRGTNRWPMCHIGNVSRAAYLASTGDWGLGKAINLMDSEVTSIEEYYRLIIETFFPQKRGCKSITLPFWLGYALGALSSSLSKALGMEHPLFDPTLYGLYSVSKNLDFDNSKMLELFSSAGELPVERQTALREFKEWAAGLNGYQNRG